MTPAETTARLLVAFLVIALAVMVWVVTVNMVHSRPMPVRVITVTAGLVNLVLASWIAVMVWMAPV